MKIAKNLPEHHIKILQNSKFAADKTHYIASTRPCQSFVIEIHSLLKKLIENGKIGKKR